MNSNHLEHYIKAINKIDDHFEYANESLKDRAFIHKVLAELTENLSKPKREIPTRIISRFQLLPKSLNGEWKWLCTVKVKQEQLELTALMPDCKDQYKYLAWVDREWIE